MADKQDDLTKLLSLNKQAIELYQAGKFPEAIPIAQEFLELSEKALGADPSIRSAVPSHSCRPIGATLLRVSILFQTRSSTPRKCAHLFCPRSRRTALYGAGETRTIELTTCGAGLVNPAAAVSIQFNACSRWR
jgi:hypothetical protein